MTPYVRTYVPMTPVTVDSPLTVYYPLHCDLNYDLWVGSGKTHDVILTVDDCSLPLLLFELSKVMRQKRESEQPATG